MESAETHFAQQFREPGGVVGFLEGDALVGLGDFGIALAVGGAGHGEVHADLAALAVEVHPQAFDDPGIDVLGDADDVLGSPGDRAVAGSFEASRPGPCTAGIRRGSVTFEDVTADRAGPFHLRVLLDI